MSISPLIKHQEIIIDSHKRNYAANWDNTADDIHLHKKSKEKQKYEIRIPLNSNKEVNITNVNGSNGIPSWLKKEIRDAFVDKQKREKFVKDVVDAIKEYNGKAKTQEQRARQALGNIKRAFGLDYPRAIIKGWIRNSLKLYAQFYEDQGIYYHIMISGDQIFIGETSLSSLLEYLNKMEIKNGNKWRFEFEEESDR